MRSHGDCEPLVSLTTAFGPSSCSLLLHVAQLGLQQLYPQLPSHLLLARSWRRLLPKPPLLATLQQHPLQSRPLQRYQPRRQLPLRLKEPPLAKGQLQTAKGRARPVMLRRHLRLQGPKMPTCSSWLARETLSRVSIPSLCLVLTAAASLPVALTDQRLPASARLLIT